MPLRSRRPRSRAADLAPPAARRPYLLAPVHGLTAPEDVSHERRTPPSPWPPLPRPLSSRARAR
jgi:hypothetical protein